MEHQARDVITACNELTKSFAKVENWKVAELPVSSRSNSGFLLMFNEASSKLVQVMAVILARKTLIFFE